jgi:hypothetical protein
LINFRFHLISLIAVFLALAVGVVMGYGVLGQPTVDTLQSRIDTVEARANKIKAENGELRADNKRLAQSMASVGEFAVTSRLANKAMVPVAVRGVDESEVVETVQLARQGGPTSSPSSPTRSSCPCRASKTRRRSETSGSTRPRSTAGARPICSWAAPTRGCGRRAARCRSRRLWSS